MIVLASIIALQSARWNEAKIRPEKVHYVQAIVVQISQSRPRYIEISAKTGGPWQTIAVMDNI
jgi:lysozyme family protein